MADDAHIGDQVTGAVVQAAAVVELQERAGDAGVCKVHDEECPCDSGLQQVVRAHCAT